MKKEDLLVNGLKYPYGVDDRPVFSWKVEVSGYGSAQTAYQIIVCSDEEKAQQEVGNLWDSGKVMSENPYDVVYAGAALSSKTDYFWRVQTWNEKGECSGWSETAVFATGICRQEEWLGCWIGAGEHMPKKKAEDSPMSSPEEDKYSRRAPMLRKTFTVSGKVKSARLFVSGLGLFELEINGQRPDDSVLNPGNTQYTETVLYRAFDVTGLLAEGKNAIGVELGNSFYNEHTGVWKWQTAKWRDNPKLLLNLDIHYEDGRKETVVSDTSWKVYTNGPTVANSIYLGDVWDANLALPGWTEADFDDENWPDAQEAEAPSGKLICQTMPPVRRFCAAKAKTIEKIGPDSWIVEAPEMLSGWAKIRMKGAAGQKIRITYGEQRTENGQVAMTGDGKGMCGEWWPEGIIQQDQYICDGTERFWEPKFSYKGYRYVQVDGYEGELTADDVILYGLANEVETISDFKCSEKTLEKLHEIMVRTLRNNFLWKPTDTPIWEKNGWLGDANVSLPSMFYQYDMRHFMKHFVDIMKDCFHEYGSIPCMVPSADWEVHNQPVWNTLFVFAAEYLYDYYGQLETVRQLYPDLKSYALKNIEECASYGWTWKDGQLADWVAPMGDTMLETIGDSSEGAAICGSVYVYMMLGSMTRLASLVGADEDIEIYRQAIGQIYSAFQKKFYRPEEKMYDTGYWAQVGKRKRYRQTSVLLPMSAGMVPDEVTADVMARLVQDIHEKGDHLDTGCVGTKFILPVLADNGYADLAWTVLMQDTYPGWGYWLQNGADSAWESWELVTRSRDHYFLGTCDEFFYSHLCGIREVKDGCRNVTIKPLFYPGLDYAETRMQTVRGELESAWKRKADGRICLQVKVPYGAVAQIHLPAQTVEIVRGAEGITGQGEGILTAVSGDYMFYIS